jgi:hypothetical protein
LLFKLPPALAGGCWLENEMGFSPTGLNINRSSGFNQIGAKAIRIFLLKRILAKAEIIWPS